MSDTLESQADPHPTGRRRRRGRIIAGVATALVVAGIGGPAAVLAVPEDAPAPVEQRSEAFAAEQSLGGVTLDRLAGELADLGLVLTITPGSSPVQNAADGTTPGGATIDDPFAGMSDAEIDALTDAEFAAMLEQAGWVTDDPSAMEPGEDAETPIGVFTVDGDRLGTGNVAPDVADDARKIWERFVTLIPADQRQMVVGFELLSEDFGGAYVYATDDDPTKWVLAVGRGLGDELDGVLIHEFGHLLTLQAREVPPGNDADTCSTYFTGEGCALSGSTFARFVDRFWPQSMIDDVNRIQETADRDAADAFYNRHRDEFVTDYATTNPGEDLAETFAVFVMGDKPVGDTIADRKVRFLWDDPAMTALRDQIRVDLSADAVPVG